MSMPMVQVSIVYSRIKRRDLRNFPLSCLNGARNEKWKKNPGLPHHKFWWFFWWTIRPKKKQNKKKNQKIVCYQIRKCFCCNRVLCFCGWSCLSGRQYNLSVAEIYFLTKNENKLCAQARVTANNVRHCSTGCLETFQHLTLPKITN